VKAGPLGTGNQTAAVKRRERISSRRWPLDATSKVENDAAEADDGKNFRAKLDAYRQQRRSGTTEVRRPATLAFGTESSSEDEDASDEGETDWEDESALLASMLRDGSVR
jgi:hypothetical protein